MKAEVLTKAPARETSRGAAITWYDYVMLGAIFISFLAALYTAFIYAPTEAVQGDAQRIFYFHMAIATMAFLSFFVVFVASVLYLWKRQEKWDILGKSSAEIGVVFTTLTLFTGAIWGKPIWGTWWSWDARMTTTLILWAIYVVYLMLRSYASDAARGARYAAILGIVGFVDVPIDYESVNWWRTLHPGPVVLEGAMTGEMVVAMMVSLVAFTIFYAFLLRQRMRIELIRSEIDRLREDHA